MAVSRMRSKNTP